MSANKTQSAPQEQNKLLIWQCQLEYDTTRVFLFSYNVSAVYRVARLSVSNSQSHLSIVNWLVSISSMWFEPVYSNSVCLRLKTWLTGWCCRNRLRADNRECTAKQTSLLMSYLLHCAQLFPEACSTEPLATSTSPDSTWCHSALCALPDKYLYSQ